MTRWEALVRYDSEIREAATQLMPFGAIWVDKLGEAFFALSEDRRYLSGIVAELIKEAEYLEAHDWLQRFSKTYDGQATSKEALAVLIQAQASGYRLTKEPDGTFAMGRHDRGTSYLRSNADILRFGQFVLKLISPTDN